MLPCSGGAGGLGRSWAGAGAGWGRLGQAGAGWGTAAERAQAERLELNSKLTLSYSQ